jgi:hypothetical protein
LSATRVSTAEMICGVYTPMKKTRANAYIVIVYLPVPNRYTHTGLYVLLARVIARFMDI